MGDCVASIFLSYADADKPLAHALGDGLRDHGCRVWTDRVELRVGDFLIERISEAIDRADFVVILVSRASVDSDWCRKELSLAMNGEIRARRVRVLPLRIDRTPMPEPLRDKIFLDVAGDRPDDAVAALLDGISRHLHPGETLSPKHYRAVGPRSPCGDPRVDEPVRLTGIDLPAVVGSENSRGGDVALYAVPFTLSAIPDPEWQSLFRPNWTMPPRWSKMHRPGIARVVGDRIILDGTTIEEVEQFHLETLQLVVAVTNYHYNELLDRRRLSASAGSELQARIRAATARLNFDQLGGT
jgi:hypothetical protein